MLVRKAAKDWCRRVVMVPGNGDRFGCLIVTEEIKSLCGGRGFTG